ncbi:hypothetical protein NXW58_06005 [Bacteroides faecis]|nr:hypothetical protein NXW58_06005 [Bacteroides faecis]
MKTKYFMPVLFLFLSALLVCCTEEFVGQPSTDSTSPGTISVVKVESTPVELTLFIRLRLTPIYFT